MPSTSKKHPHQPKPKPTLAEVVTLITAITLLIEAIRKLFAQ